MNWPETSSANVRVLERARIAGAGRGETGEGVAVCAELSES